MLVNNRAIMRDFYSSLLLSFPNIPVLSAAKIHYKQISCLATQKRVFRMKQNYITSHHALHTRVSLYIRVTHTFLKRVALCIYNFIDVWFIVPFCSLELSWLLFLLALLGALGQLTFASLNLSPTSYKSLGVSAVTSVSMETQIRLPKMRLVT